MFPRLTGLGDVSCSVEVFLGQVGLHWALIVLQSLHLLENLAVCRLLCQEATRLVKPLVVGLAVWQRGNTPPVPIPNTEIVLCKLDF